jgi:hypothetical protein
MMPPPSAKNPLSPEQKRILREWVKRGAEYTQHWAFVAPKSPAVPEVKGASWARNAIDRFVLARLEKEGLKPAPEAEKLTLLRRVYIDLIGLPPTPAEADAFLADTRPGAHERVVERLLASPAYGERWGRKWLDLARYADTNGYEKDRPRSMWPWRDWVIRSLNANMPFDEFTLRQLAGDMLPEKDEVATGLHRNTMLNEEGGIDPLEFRFHAMTDRVSTTATTWLGLTLGCAQCHSHKFDPFSQTEYYQFMAFLDNADEVTIDVPNERVKTRREAALRKVRDAEAALASKFPGGEKAREEAFQKWLKAEKAKAVVWRVMRPAKARSNLPLLTIEKDGGVFCSGDMSKADTYEVTFRNVREGITALRLEVLADGRLPNGGPGRVYYEGPFGDFFLSEVTVLADGKPVKLVDASNSFASGGSTAKAALDGNKQTGWSINGGQGKDHHAVFRLEKPLGKVKELTVRLLCERYYAAGLGRFRISATTGSTPAVARALPLDADELLLTKEPGERLRQIHLMAAPELAKVRQEVDALRRAVPAYPTTMVFRERPAHHPRPTHRRHRGEFLQVREKVSPGTPQALGLPKDAPKDRLGFARWLLSAENPLTARVVVNRHWAAFFATGVVGTVQDFGTQGELPSHPELLDWLAAEYRTSGWDTKRLHRLIVTSATYRQSSAVTAALREKDPKNRLLARGPRLRLEAEQIRDAVLSASGLLHMKLGGPSVFPPQPANVTTEGAYGRLDWKVSPGLDRYRRGLYTFMKRTAPFAMAGTFDGPSGEFCVAKRESSNTALQALTMLNDQAILEAAQEMGRRAMTDYGSVNDRVRIMFRRVLTRAPTPQERDMLLRFVLAQKARAKAKAFDAAALAGAGPGDVNERAAWVALARVLFNLDEFIVRG